MKNKKGILAVISAAVAGSIISTVITLSAVGIIKNDTAPSFGDASVVSSQAYKSDYALMADETEKTVLSVEEISKRVGPSIVGISSTTKVQSYFGTQTGKQSGSGIIIDEKGHIVTNYHVIENGSEIKVSLTSGNVYDAELVGGDEKTDIAVLKINANEELRVATLGNSDEVEVGSLAVAIGNPLASELFGTVTAGVISGVNRTITVGQREMNLIQTDAAISPGNSGGALINKYGEIIGINSVKLVDDAAEGLGFAIPMNEAVPIIKDLMQYGYVKGRPMIGISVREITSEIAYYNNLLSDHGLYIMSVTEGSGAEKAGLTRGDIIIECEGKAINTMTELNSVRDKHKAGESISLTVLRGNKEIKVSVTLTEDMSGKVVK